MAQSLRILVGTMTGTADLVAQEIETALGTRGIQVEIVQMDGRDETVFEAGGLYLVCTSTYGQGDVPDNARLLMERLEATRPDLSAVRYGLVALGDSTYAATYCHGGLKFDETLRALGATRVGDVLCHDASAGTIPEDVAVEWIGGWIEEACSASAAA